MPDLGGRYRIYVNRRIARDRSVRTARAEIVKRNARARIIIVRRVGGGRHEQHLIVRFVVRIIGARKQAFRRYGHARAYPYRLLHAQRPRARRRRRINLTRHGRVVPVHRRLVERGVACGCRRAEAVVIPVGRNAARIGAVRHGKRGVVDCKRECGVRIEMVAYAYVQL